MNRMKTAVYVSVCSWAEDHGSITEQRKICKAYLKHHSELELIVTYKNSSKTEAWTDLEPLLKEVMNRRVECIVCPSAGVIFSNERELQFYVLKVFIPAGIRLILIKDGFDSAADDAEKVIRHICRERKRADGENQPKEQGTAES